MSLPPRFRRLRDHELDRLSDEELIAYLRTAREQGENADATLALRILVFGYQGILERRARMKVPRERAEDVAAEALVSAVAGEFRGESIGEFRSWLNTIVDRRVADFHRRKRLDEQPLDPGNEEGVGSSVPSQPDATGAVETRALIDSVLIGLSDVHRYVVERNVLDGCSARETAAEILETFEWMDIPMSESNVHQIASRFRRDLRRALNGDTSP